MNGRGAGTDSRGGVDPAALRALAQGPGADTRYWCSMGTVGTLDDDTGEFDVTDKRAILIGPEGTEVDVRLEPADQLVTCRYAGVQAGEVTIFAPIHPGDLVLVMLPDGGTAQPTIAAIIQSRSLKQPLGPNRRPIFDNQRLLIHAKSVPIDIRTAGGTQVLLEQNGTATVKGAKVVADADDVRLGGPGASHAIPQGDNLQTAINTLADAVQVYTDAVAIVLVPTAPAAATFAAAVAAFKALPYLSSVSKTE